MTARARLGLQAGASERVCSPDRLGARALVRSVGLAASRFGRREVGPLTGKHSDAFKPVRLLNKPVTHSHKLKLQLASFKYGLERFGSAQ